jgi:hypothetical protein
LKVKLPHEVLEWFRQWFEILPPLIKQGFPTSETKPPHESVHGWKGYAQIVRRRPLDLTPVSMGCSFDLYDPSQPPQNPGLDWQLQLRELPLIVDQTHG